MSMKITSIRSMAETALHTDVRERVNTRSGIGNKRRCNVLSTRDFNDYSISLDRYPLQPSEHSDVTNNYVSYNIRLERRKIGSNNVTCMSDK